ncbi:hydroxymethylglutaryl-CoA lyase [Sphingobacterium hungaricum]|uniref:Hydroxymethylglutaryl-CoA lyase n=1 Tax=Sphingobacterium hungaricum TaxID=2082723 RepID=A0A928UWT6_9SPHI|nr:hydroxymethylglutaryl-CoA lyase [Sphingobacterium hungaricum]MBE8712941.1 hydroxymethylglutaryl-CoA lyase [Sphingobacterium hungaricum]
MSNKKEIELVDCPRDAIQGISHFISTERKVDYINQLIESNLLDCIDFGSFVSPKAVPQMQDTALVIDRLDKSEAVKLLAIVANDQGAEIATKFPKIDYLGYPFSISETFQQRNTNSSIEKSIETIKSIQSRVSKTNQELVVYLSMGFGNPYGDFWSKELVLDWIDVLQKQDVKNFSIADTTAEASPEIIKEVFTEVSRTFGNLEIGVHLHSRVENAQLKIDAAYDAGCRKFEGAILGYGGCPFAKDELVGNIPTELLLERFQRGEYAQISAIMNSFQEMIKQ